MEITDTRESMESGETKQLWDTKQTMGTRELGKIKGDAVSRGKPSPVP